MRCRPRVRQFRLAHTIFIPAITLEAGKPTVLNCFWFRQTDLIPGSAVREHTTPLNFNEQRGAWKMKALFPFRFHNEVVSQWPFAADEFQMQTRNSIRSGVTIPDHCEQRRLILGAAQFYKPAR